MAVAVVRARPLRESGGWPGHPRGRAIQRTGAVPPIATTATHRHWSLSTAPGTTARCAYGAGRGRVLALVVLLGVASPMTSRLVVATAACPASPRRRVGKAQVVSSRIAEQTHVFGRTTSGSQTASVGGPASASEFTGRRTGEHPLIVKFTVASLRSSDGVR